MHDRVRYHPIWAVLYIFFGILFTIIFILGYVVLQQITDLISIVFGLFLIFIGNSFRKQPYMEYGEHFITVFNFFGKPRKKYTFQSKKDVFIDKNRLYLNGKKISANDWMIRKEDWMRALAFYSKDSDALIEELKG